MGRVDAPPVHPPAARVAACRRRHPRRPRRRVLLAAGVVAGRRRERLHHRRERAEDFPGVSGLLVAEAAADAGRGKPVLWLPDFDAAERALAPELREGDLLLVLGAGNVDALGRRLVA